MKIWFPVSIASMLAISPFMSTAAEQATASAVYISAAGIIISAAWIGEQIIKAIRGVK